MRAHSDQADQAINIIGAGLAGALLSIMLARHGRGPLQVFDRRPDPRLARTERGRSINLALAARGMRALEHAGVMDRVRPLLIPMTGRMIHERSGTTTLQAYGQRSHEVIYSVSRAALNQVLIEEAANHPGVTLRFDQTCLGVDLPDGLLHFRNGASGERYSFDLTTTIATDGAGSAVRSSLVSAGHLSVREDWLDHDYKELTIPPLNGQPQLAPNALHIWPRGGFMLIALPNTDHSFTVTLFLARKGPRSFEALRDSQSVRNFFAEEFPDAVPLMPHLEAEFQANPTGQLGTVYTQPWQVAGQLLLLGDAAHAIVPFHGQGMNAAFEDCRVLDSLLDRFEQWEPLFTEFQRLRQPDTAAIAQMALENYTEMRDTVLDPSFVRQKKLSLELERRFPNRFIPRYAMVMFHPEIPYSEALRRGAIQSQILAELDRSGPTDLEPTDLKLAEQLISERLPTLGPA